MFAFKKKKIGRADFFFSKALTNAGKIDIMNT